MAPGASRRWLPATTRICARACAIVLAIIVVLGGLIAGRIAFGPVDLGWLAPVLERRVAGLPDPMDLTIGGLVLVWDREDRGLAIRARDITLSAAGGEELARFPAADIGLRLRDLLVAQIGLSRVQLIGPRLEVVWMEGGRWRLAALNPDEDQRTGGEVPIAELLARLTRSRMAPTDGDPLIGLEVLEIRDGQIVVRAAGAPAARRTADVGLKITRNGQGVAGDVRLTLDPEGRQATLELRARLPRDVDTVSGTLALSRVVPAGLASLVPDPEAAILAALDLPVAGQLGFALDLDGTLQRMNADLSLSEGSLMLAERFAGPFAVRAGHVTGRWDADSGEAIADRLEIRLGTAAEPGPTLTANGTGAWMRTPAEVSGNLKISDLAMADLARWWPENLAAGPRSWITRNITAGTIDRASAGFRASLAGPEAVTLHRIAGDLAYRDLSVAAYAPAPPVTGLTGTGTLDASSLQLQASGGRLEGLAFDTVKVTISGLDAGDQSIALNTSVSGPVAGIVRLLRSPGVELFVTDTLKPEQVDGQIDGHVRIGFPLRADLAIDQLDFHGEGKITGAELRDVVAGVTLTGGPVDLKIDGAELTATGPVKAEGVPVKLTWRHRFGGTKPERLSLKVTVPRLDAAGRSALGLETAPYLEGVLSGELDARFGTDHRATVEVQADLKQAAMAMAPLHWSKQAGVAGMATARVRIAADGAVTVERLDLEAGTLAAKGTAALDASRQIRRIDLERLAFGNSAVDSVTISRDPKPWQVSLKGGEIDARPFLAGAGTSSGGPAPDVTLTARGLRRIIMGEGRALRNVSVRARRTDGGWEEIRLEAAVSAAPAVTGEDRPGSSSMSSSSMSFRFGPGNAGGRFPLRLQAGRAGDLFHAVGGIDAVVGGTLTVTGEADGAIPTSNATLHVRLNDFAYRQQSAPQRALAAAGRALKGQGNLDFTRFDRLQGDVRLDGGIIRIDKVAAHNATLGISGQGTVDLANRTVDLTGAAVPARGLNQLLGSIPLLGDLFTTGEGFIAVQFTVSGALTDPRIETHPVRSLTPSLLAPLRELFSAIPVPRR